MKLDLPALESWLWEAACVIRGPVDAPKFKDYVQKDILGQAYEYHNASNVKGPGATVVRSGLSAGKPLFIERDFWAHNVVLYVMGFHGNDPKFVFYMLGALGLTKFRTGVAVPTLNRNTFSGIQIAVPPLPDQREIATQMSAVDAKLAAEESRRAALAALFQSLLNYLMTGQVRLPEFVK